MGTGSVDTADAREVVDVPDGTFVVAGAKVFDGARFRPATSVLVVEGRIAAVEDRPTPPAHAPAGVRLLAGTDAASPGTAHGVGLHDELALLVRAGLLPGQALTAATQAPAACFPTIADRGRIAPGSPADLLPVDGDPAVDITATRAIRDVWRRGRHVPRRTGRG